MKRKKLGRDLRLREQLGLTQLEFAEYLDVPRSMVSMEETGVRKGIGDMGDRKWLLQRACWEVEKSDIPLFQFYETEKGQQKLAKQLNNLMYEVDGLKRQAQAMKKKYEEAVLLYKGSMLAIKKYKEEVSPQRAVLRKFIEKAKGILEETNLLTLELLDEKIQSWNRKIELLEKYVITNQDRFENEEAL